MFKVNTTKFRNALSEYRKYSRRTDAEIVNTKAHFTARDAVRFTKRAVPADIRRYYKQKVLDGAPLVGVIVNIQRKKKGLKGLSGEKMKVEADKLIKRSIGHRGFLASGWLPAVRLTAPYALTKKNVRDKQLGKDKGGAKPAARSGAIKTTALIWNAIEGGKSHRKDPHPLLIEAAQRAVDNQARDMVEFTAKRKQKDIERFNRH